ncbi:hypothetical protein PENSPDRAFT_693803 [Peniophora sp. CONT]|nr:hypothetical protein PENSPDRAFT_693803 [Peniophora sp. CONT]
MSSIREQSVEESAAPEGRQLALASVFNCSINFAWLARLLSLFGGPRVTTASDWEPTVLLLMALLNFEAKTFFQDGTRLLSCRVTSINMWLYRRERAVVIDPVSALEEHFGDEVAYIWLKTRQLPVDQVASMYGEEGISVVVRSLLQWRAIDPTAEDWVVIVADVTAALELLRDHSSGTGVGSTLADVLEGRDIQRAERARIDLKARSDSRAQRNKGRKRSRDVEPPAGLQSGRRVRKRRN